MSASVIVHILRSLTSPSWDLCVTMWLCLFALTTFLSFVKSNSYLTLKIEPKEEQCFYEDVNKGDHVRFEYHVIDGGLLDIDIRVL